MLQLRGFSVFAILQRQRTFYGVFLCVQMCMHQHVRNSRKTNMYLCMHRSGLPNTGFFIVPRWIIPRGKLQSAQSDLATFTNRLCVRTIGLLMPPHCRCCVCGKVSGVQVKIVTWTVRRSAACVCVCMRRSSVAYSVLVSCLGERCQ